MGIGLKELMLIAVVLAVYFLPHLIARSRHHANKTAIFMLNLLAGWTVIGWIGALVWALTSQGGKRKECPHCAEQILAQAKLCRYCGKEMSTP